MADQAQTRKFAAILSVDAAGYTRLMADDEAATVVLTEVLFGSIAADSGRPPPS